MCRNELETCPFTLVRPCSRLPVLRADDGETHQTRFINIGMVDLCLESYLLEDATAKAVYNAPLMIRGQYLGRPEWVLCRKHYLNSESSSVIRRLLLDLVIKRGGA